MCALDSVLRVSVCRFIIQRSLLLVLILFIWFLSGCWRAVQTTGVGASIIEESWPTLWFCDLDSPACWSSLTDQVLLVTRQWHCWTQWSSSVTLLMSLHSVFPGAKDCPWVFLLCFNLQLSAGCWFIYCLLTTVSACV